MDGIAEITQHAASHHVEPDAERMHTYREYYDAYTRLYPTNAGVMHRLSELAADADDPEIDGIARL
ncbi:MAG TPA: hypothetical protein VHJ55_09970 [Casimicrobiaceae bacterium]|nr:hypothetical protein [Casimicrobiaceae bacterium]